jgi:hypothetical protein
MTQLSDDYPVLLGPVRIETRFTPTELLIRVFPDEWAIDKFEPKPTQAEIDALDAYWIAVWRAAGDQLAEDAAWHELTARIPAGRASWLLQPDQHHRPANPADKPSGLAAGTVVLVVVSDQALPANDRQPTVTYWTAVWRAHGDRAELRAADIALLAAVGANRAAAIRARVPVGVDAAPTAQGDAVAVSFLVLPPPAAADVAPRSWTQAATARLLPDRFTVLGYAAGRQVLSATGAPVPATLPVSPEPGAADQLRVDEQTGVLHVPDSLRWLTDFDRAVQVGMGLRIPLTDQIRGGLDRLVVFGLREQATPEQAAADLGALITRQVRSPAGFGLLPQGTATNNTEQAPAGQGAKEVAVAVAGSAAGPAAAAGPASWTAKTDGQWFAELLGLDPAVLAGMPNADGTDHRDARAANVALWPATWGNFLQTTLHPILAPQAVRQTRDFFVRYVSGRGPIPAIKVGRQPYGIMPTTAFSRLAWPDGAAGSPAAALAAHRRGLQAVLAAAAQDWQAATAKVARLRPEPDPAGDPADDPHQTLLDILALHPTSAEYHQRYAQSVEDIFNRENLGGLGATVLPALNDVLHMSAPIQALLARFGFHVDPALADRVPDLVRRLFVGAQYPILAPLVDDRPLSETERVRGYLPDGGNYLRWLADHAGTDLETIRLESGFTGNRPPAALLYLFLRHAVLLGWIEAGRLLAIEKGSAEIPSTADPLFVNVRFADPPESLPSESRFRQLYSPDQRITGDPSPTRLVHQYIPGALGQTDATAQLAEQVTALGLLAGLPTARLERVFAEHLDCATYRLDAWRLGLATERLAQLRYGPAGDGDGGAAAKRGVHIGAYGWLEEVRPRTKQLTPVQLTGQLAQVFAGPAPLQHDAAGGGYVHAPSPSHATTAAVLRAGYVANLPPGDPGADPGPFAVNLSSERVRAALRLLDGMRQGQSLGALLGYRFERGLHEGHPGVELDRFITPLRAAFPLRAGRLPGATPAPDTPVELVEARNVVDGLELVRRATRPPNPQPAYPYGAAALLPDDATPDEKDAIDEEVQRLLDLNDALADLALAEGTHQALLGNPERASATLDAYAKEGLPPQPAVVETPRSGIALTHRLAVQLRAGLDPDHGGTLFQGNGPRAKAEPAVNDWLPTWLPGQQDVVALVTWTDPVTGKPASSTVAQSDVGLQPIDLLWAVRPAGDPAMTGLDDRIVGFVAGRDRPRPDAVLTIAYTHRVPGKVTFFELSPLVDALRRLLTTSRPTRPTDLMAAAGAAAVDRAADAAVSLPKERPVAVRDALTRLRQDVAGFITDLAPLYPADPAPPNRAQLLSKIDTFLGRYGDLILTADGFGMVRSGWGELLEWRRGVYAGVLTAVADTAARMARALAAADALIAQEAALPASTPAEDRFRLLQQAERLLTTKPTTPRPATPQQLRTIVKNRRKTFNDKLQKMLGEAKTTQKTLSGLLAQVGALLPLTDLDPTGLDLAPFGDRVVTFGRDLLDRATALRAEIDKRLAAAAAALADYDQAVTGPDRVRAATEALAAMLGDDVLAIPEFTVTDQLATDWKKARGDSTKLIKHLVDAGRDFPVDDWLHGLARVREKPRLWEKAVLISDALRDKGGVLGDQADPELTPVQLPYRANDHWLGMDFAAGTTITEDRLLFTAFYTTDPPVLNNGAHVGLLLDEWTEVVPAGRETTGIAVNYDRPDAEPPQAMLLVTPPAKTGTWSVDDLVAAVHETFDLAKTRAVEPRHIEDIPGYAQLLPATVLSATRQPITVSTDLSIANLRWKSASP